MELEKTYSTKGLTSLEVEWEPSYEGLKFEARVTLTVTETVTVIAGRPEDVFSPTFLKVFQPKLLLDDLYG